MALYVGAQNTSTTVAAGGGGGAWEVIATTNFNSSSAAYGESKGWDNTTYSLVKAVMCGVSSGTWQNTLVAIQFYSDSTNGNDGTLQTAEEYKWAQTKKAYTGSSDTNSSGNTIFWEIDGNSGKNWSGEIYFPLKYHQDSNDTPSACYANLWQQYSYIQSGCINEDVSYNFLTGARIGQYSGASIDTSINWTKGYIQWLGLKL